MMMRVRGGCRARLWLLICGSESEGAVVAGEGSGRTKEEGKEQSKAARGRAQAKLVGRGWLKQRSY